MDQLRITVFEDRLAPTSGTAGSNNSTESLEGETRAVVMKQGVTG